MADSLRGGDTSTAVNPDGGDAPSGIEAGAAGSNLASEMIDVASEKIPGQAFGCPRRMLVVAVDNPKQFIGTDRAQCVEQRQDLTGAGRGAGRPDPDFCRLADPR
jgi:hypothetical protein